MSLKFVDLENCFF